MSNVEELKAKYKQASGDSPVTDKGIKGTLVDDYAIAILSKLCTLIAILVLGSILFLWLERTIGKAGLTPYRIWLPVAGWGFLAFTHKPFLRFGWWGALCTMAIIPTVSGYLWQLFQSMVGSR